MMEIIITKEDGVISTFKDLEPEAALYIYESAFKEKQEGLDGFS